ncbi:MAG: hypothetical protein KAH17_02600 [Bacteroidales bacterium]|nr:hypothetical protein [Bacteroidales bacterium]
MTNDVFYSFFKTNANFSILIDKLAKVEIHINPCTTIISNYPIRDPNCYPAKSKIEGPCIPSHGVTE